MVEALKGIEKIPHQLTKICDVGFSAVYSDLLFFLAGFRMYAKCIEGFRAYIMFYFAGIFFGNIIGNTKPDKKLCKRIMTGIYLL